MLRNKVFFIGIIGLALYLRLFQFGANPPSLYWEEVALGYDAYSLLKTGADHHGNVLPIVALESFGDWKPALYAYLIIPFITLFDLSAVAVRMPSLLAGISMLFAIYLLAKRLGQNPLIAMAVLAIAPWAVHFSRAGWEAHVATALIVWGVYFGVATVGSQSKFKSKNFAAAVLLLVLSLYTYHAARIVGPLVGLALVVFVAKSLDLKKLAPSAWRQLAAITLLAVVAVVPLLLKISSPEILQRSRETSIFSDVSIILESNDLREQADYSFVSRLIYHRSVLFGKEILSNALAHFSPQYLFQSGDSQVRHSVQFFGHLYHVELLFVVIGFFVWMKKRDALRALLLIVAVVAVLPASISTGAPHALRSMTLFPVLVLVIAEGIEVLVSMFRPHKIRLSLLTLAIISIYAAELSSFWLYYSKVYPTISAREWQYGYSDMISSLEKTMLEHPDLPVYVSRAAGRPAMYYWFFTKTDPALVQAADEFVKKDQGEFLEFNAIRFFNSESDLPQSDAVRILATPDSDQTSWTVMVGGQAITY
ncbi:MAG: hypothetical protein O2840_01020 [bacterium]|nr:hypothetical protein [bacterium]